MYIYRICHTATGKSYVGQTRTSLRKRWNGHKTDARKTRVTMAITNAIRKYGPEAFSIELLEEAEDRDDLDMAERFWMGVYDSMVPNGYNVMGGGSFTKVFSPEMRSEISARQTGRKLSDAHRANMSAGQKDRILSADDLAERTGDRSLILKLTWAEVREIRRLHATGEWSQVKLAARFKVSQPNVSLIIRGETWIEA